MIATMEYVSILDNAEKLGEMVFQSEVMEDYLEKKLEMEQDAEAQKLIKAFNHIKDHYEDIQRFGRYHPDYQEIMKKVRSTKRAMDMHDTVAAFKVAERNLQSLLDEISSYVATSVSEQIKVPKDGALLTDNCGCGSGGGCGCAS
ncbi:YlbF family regulator [Oceanobacillus luteolus]|uniref:YlbF family regulator n=1 Tax=Oceanobacillus luteolus TaxID=1274358 RepID=A0ABW4HR34_9BACI|nr:YlbF family regulator [Oceanobacillus luteolus]MCM3742250.1 YlbF family regulator [Oceanobacillus luteolus]